MTKTFIYFNHQGFLERFDRDTGIPETTQNVFAAKEFDVSHPAYGHIVKKIVENYDDAFVVRIDLPEDD